MVSKHLYWEEIPLLSISVRGGTAAKAIFCNNHDYGSGGLNLLSIARVFLLTASLI